MTVLVFIFFTLRPKPGQQNPSQKAADFRCRTAVLLSVLLLRV
jgi:hypothetical protein